MEKRSTAVWVWSCVLLTASGCLGSLLVFPLRTALAFVAVGGISAVLLSLPMRTEPEVPAGESGPPWSDQVRPLVVIGAWAGAGTLAVATATVAVPSLTLTLVLLLALTSPPVVTWLSARCRAADPEPVPAVPSPAIAAPPVTASASPGRMTGVADSDIDTFGPLVRAMSDQTLAVAWIESYWTLKDAATVDERLLVSKTRRAYLDEWERRAPTAFQAWLSTVPRATTSLRHEGRTDAPTDPVVEVGPEERRSPS